MANVTHEARKVTRAKVHSLCPVKFEAQKIFGAFGRPPNQNLEHSFKTTT